MSLGAQKQLDEFDVLDPEPAVRPQRTDKTNDPAEGVRRITSTVDDSRQCNGCGAHVTEAFCRTMGDNADRVHACPNCTNIEDIRRGAAAGVEHDKPTPGGPIP